MSKLSAANELSIVTTESGLLAVLGCLDLEGFLDGDVVGRPIVR